MCPPADLPLILNMHTWFIIIYIELQIYILALTLFICGPADPSIILNMHECIFRFRLTSHPGYTHKPYHISIFSSRSVYVSTCRSPDHPDYTYMAFHIIYIIIDIDLYLALGLSMCPCRPTSHPEYTYIGIPNIIYIDTYLYLAPTLFICRPADTPIVLNMHECILRMRVGSAGRQIDRAGTKYRLTSMYLIDDKPCLYIQNER